MEEQAVLWGEPVARTAPRRAAARRAAARPEPPAPPAWAVGDEQYVLAGDEFAARGWQAGTVLHVVPARRAERGELVLVVDAGRVRVGCFGVDRGRPVLRTDRGTTWLSERARVVAVATVVEAPLAV